MSKTLKTTDIYTLVLTDIKDASGEAGLGYRVVNNKTDVNEFESFMLAEALAFFDQTEGLVKDFFAEKSVDEILHS